MLSNCMLEKTLESPLNCKDIQPVHPKGTQSWIFIGKTDVEAETPILWPPDVKDWFTGKDPDAGKDWRQEEKGTTSWDGWIASPTQWTWVWVNSGSWWWTGRPGVLQSMGSQTVEHNWATELNWINMIMFGVQAHLSWVSDFGSIDKMIRGNHVAACLLITVKFSAKCEPDDVLKKERRQ